MKILMLIKRGKYIDICGYRGEALGYDALNEFEKV
jgi:hypothetical protein